MMASNRDKTFDVLKFLLILWVVWGHLQSTGFVAPSHCYFERLLWRAKVANMPAFFIISGYFALSTFQTGSWGKILARITMFAWPRAAFALVFALAEILLSDVFFHEYGVYYLFMVIYRSRWFLRTLGALYFLSATIYRLGRTDVRRWVLFGIAYVSLLAVSGGRFRHCFSYVGENQFVQMYPYFVLGLMAFRKHDFWRKWPVQIACLALFTGIILQEAICQRIGLSTWTAAPVSWRSLVFLDSALLHLAARTFLGITGTISLFALVERFLHRFPILSRLAPLGTTTMGVYVIHERPLVVAASFNLFLPAWTRGPLAIMWFLVCHSIVKALHRNPRTRIAFFGDETMLRRIFEKLSFLHVSGILFAR